MAASIPNVRDKSSEDSAVRKRRPGQSKSAQESDLKSNKPEEEDKRKHGTKGPAPPLQSGTFWLTRIVLLRFLAFIYFVAFLVAYHQNRELIGEKGLSPCRLYLSSVKRYVGGKINLAALSYTPTLLWFMDWTDMDANLDHIALGGLALSAFVLVAGCANMVLMFLLWLLYHSLVSVGQIWYSFGPDQDPRRPVLEGPDLHGLPLRDPAGAQPLGVLHAPVPPVVSSPGDPDKSLHRARRPLLCLHGTPDVCPPRSPAAPLPGMLIRRAANVSVGLLIAYLSVPVLLNLLSARQIMNTSYNPLRIVNTYGAFGSITKERTEVVLQGTLSLDPSDPSALWEEYEFKCKPGGLARRPCLISPYHYRLDWLMWFAAFQTYEQNEWVIHLAGKLLANDPGALALIEHNPFLGRGPPRWLRGEHFKYKFSSLGGGHATEGRWWVRRRIGPYFPAINLTGLRGYFEARDWPHPEIQ
ncbi:lipase maturation factor 1 isoform X2 [Polypterus senegalus]|uniref:lipase maturation factor 1 isoform X2 n=1 Tax=Polypterus senegalus TaxID=55291 RepID=UPI001962D9CF|nr:lipase maturation factor 1 isoform X2 [Polypterus senegalus]